MSEDGLCIIVEDATGEVVFKGGPPPPDINVAQPGAGESEASLAGSYTSSTLRLMQDATRVLISPAVAVVRLSTAAVTSVTSVSSVSGATAQGGRGMGVVAGGAPVRSVSGTISAMAAAWQSLKGGASGNGNSHVKTATSATAAKGGGGGREMRGDGVVWKDLDKHVADVRALAEQVRARGASQMVTTQRARGQSHCPRDFSYKDKTLQVDVSGLDAVIGLRQVDDGSWEMLVEPRVTMEQLVRAAAAYNLRPPVVPEFRRITVGGSIAGIAGVCVCVWE
jgi:FAD/FMN-containing dehydrogenase